MHVHVSRSLTLVIPSILLIHQADIHNAQPASNTQYFEPVISGSTDAGTSASDSSCRWVRHYLTSRGCRWKIPSGCFTLKPRKTHQTHAAALYLDKIFTCQSMDGEQPYIETSFWLEEGSRIPGSTIKWLPLLTLWGES